MKIDKKKERNKKHIMITTVQSSESISSSHCDIFDETKELLITNLLSFKDINFKDINSRYKSKSISFPIRKSWARAVLSETNRSFPDAFVSCDSIYSNNNKIQNKKFVRNKNKTNTLFIENPPVDETVRQKFSKYSGYLGIKSSEYFGKRLCFVTFDSVDHAEQALNNCSIESTFARNSTRNYS